MRFSRHLLAIFLSLQVIPNYLLLLFVLQLPTGSLADACSSYSSHLRPRFSLVRRCQRSRQKLITLENASNLEECVKAARRVRGLAINYAPVSRRRSTNRFQDKQEGPRFDFATRRRHFWLQPEEFFNCHVLECPENATRATLVDDSRFDYFSLYGRATDSTNYTCVPGVGLFQLFTTPTAYTNASRICRRTLGGFLAHVASSARTAGLAHLLAEHNERLREREGTKPSGATIRQAFVGLTFNRSRSELPSDFVTPDDEALSCFLYRAWAPGHPRKGGSFANASCVALTTAHDWRTVDCDQRLPFVCEIPTSRAELTEGEGEATSSNPEECPQDFD